MSRPPLWMPEGSVRALLALLIVAAALVAALLGVEHHTVLVGLAGAVVGFYFRQREGEVRNGTAPLPRADEP